MLTLNTLSDSAGDLIQSADVSASGGASHSGPYYPFVMFFLGEEAIEEFPGIGSRLRQLWPHFWNNLLFLGIPDEPASDGYDVLQLDSEGTMHRARVDTSELRLRMISMGSTDSPFESKERFCFYYVFDSSEAVHGSELDGWLKRIDMTRTVLNLPYSIRESLFVLYDAILQSTPEGQSGVLQSLGQLAASNHSDSPKTFVLSNQYGDSATVNTWDRGHAIIAALVALTDSKMNRVWDALHAGAFTVKYNRAEKPVAEIGRVLVARLIQLLNEIRIEKSDDLSDTQVFASRIGITRRSVLSIVSAYVNARLGDYLPTVEQLERMPRCDDSKFLDFSALTYEELNQETFGAWTAFLDKLVDS